MPGTKAGALKGHQTKQKKYGKDYIKKMASAGGKSHNRGGFASLNKGKDGLTGPERASKLRRKNENN